MPQAPSLPPADGPAESADDLSFENSFTAAAQTAPAAPAAAQPAAPAAPTTPPATSAPSAPASLPAPGGAPAPTPAAAKPAAPAAPASPAVNPLFEAAKKYGLKLDGITNDTQLAQALIDHVRETSPYAQIGRQTLAAPQQPAAQAAPAAPAEKPWNEDEYFAELWKDPQLDPSAQYVLDNGLVELDPESGLLVSKPGFEALTLPVLNSLNQAHVAAREQRSSLFEGNPYKNIYDKLLPAIEKRILAKAEELVGGRFTQVEQQTALEKFEAENKAWLYGPDGNWSEHGQKFIDEIKSLQEDGITDQAKLLARALKAVPPPAQPAAGAAPAAPSTSQPAAAAPAPASATPQQSFLDDALDRARHSPQSQGHSQATPHAPVHVDEAELESMFVTGHRQRVGAAA